MATPNQVEILGLHGTQEALAVVSAALEDYDEAYRRHPQKMAMAGSRRRAGDPQ